MPNVGRPPCRGGRTDVRLLGEGDREAGSHRTYAERDVERLRDALRLKGLLGLTLDELKAIMEREESRDALRAELHADATPVARRREILEQGLQHVERQLGLAGPATELGKHARLSVYDDAGHAFFADDRANDVEAAAHRLWDELQELWAEHLR